MDEELKLLRDEIRALRVDREGDRRRLDALEAQLAARTRRSSTGPVDVDSESPRVARRVKAEPPALPPDLDVVKLAPEAPVAEIEDDSSAYVASSDGPGRPAVGGPTGGPDAAPPIATDVELREVEPASPGAQVAYEAGLASLATGDLAKGERLIEAFVRDHPRHKAADNALLSLGDAFAAAGQPGRALAAYERVVTGYPAGDAVARALLRYGDTCRALGRAAAARAAYQKILSAFPSADVAAAARDGLGRL